MRELQVIQSILTKVLLQVHKSNAKRVKTLHLAVGEIAELDQTALQGYWEEISKGTPAEQAELAFRFIKAEVQCMSCFMKYHPIDGKVHCPHCGSYGAKILAGEEFYLESVELDE
jgi:hydrogenase nickel incorporation protein HypA/HybF